MIARSIPVSVISRMGADLRGGFDAQASWILRCVAVLAEKSFKTRWDLLIAKAAKPQAASSPWYWLTRWSACGSDPRRWQQS